jgi:hypothetical protein
VNKGKKMLNLLLILVLGAAVVYLHRRLEKLEKTPATKPTEFDLQRVYRIAADTIREHEKDHH